MSESKLYDILLSLVEELTKTSETKIVDVSQEETSKEFVTICQPTIDIAIKYAPLGQNKPYWIIKLQRFEGSGSDLKESIASTIECKCMAGEK